MRDAERHGADGAGEPDTDRGPRTAAAALLAATLCLIAGCAGVPAGSSHADAELSRTATRLAEQIGFVDDDALAGYVAAVGRRVSANASRPGVSYRFHVLDMGTPNALALPDGNVYISRGLLVLVNSEDELAGALAHEIAHVERDHASGRSNVSIATAPIRIGTGLAGYATAIFSPEVGEAIASFGETASNVVLAPYSRDQEREADDVGQQLMLAAGYDPAGLSRLLDVIARSETLDDAADTGSDFFSTHPATAERVSTTRAHAAALGGPAAGTVILERAALLERLAGLPVGRNPAQGFFEGDWFIHPQLGFALRFPAEWEKVNTASFVGAKAADDEVFLTVSPVAEGEDPVEGARRLSGKVGVDIASDAKRLEINGLAAAVNQAQVGDGPKANALLLTWVAHRGVIYEIMGLAPLARYEAVRGELTRATSTFRALTREELGRIEIIKLDIVAARDRESLAELAARTRSVWPQEVIAVVNGRELGDRLRAGELVKVAVPRPVAPAD
ncbi:MAG: M48 family metalloprotease [Gammaproteobacteria bacterium]|nr:M48 family metalloprotease [Gammaproteobacteria bacterium]